MISKPRLDNSFIMAEQDSYHINHDAIPWLRQGRRHNVDDRCNGRFQSRDQKLPDGHGYGFGLDVDGDDVEEEDNGDEGDHGEYEDDGGENATCAVGGRPGFRVVVNPAVGMLECCMPCKMSIVRIFMMMVRIFMMNVRIMINIVIVVIIINIITIVIIIMIKVRVTWAAISCKRDWPSSSAAGGGGGSSSWCSTGSSQC